MEFLTIFKRGVHVCTVAALGLAIAACGSKPKGGGGGGAPVGKVESAFLKAAAENKIPVRILMATGYLESQLVPNTALANYVTIGSEEPTKRGTIMSETAFAQTFATLGLDSTAADAQTLEVQIGAYAKWLRSRIDEAGLSLVENPRERDDLFYWIELMSKVQRNGLEGRQNVQILFAKELIDILNKGFTWQDQGTGEMIQFQPEQRPIQFTDFSQNGQNFFNLIELRGTFFGATYLPLATVGAPSDFVNKPKRIEVIHCPLALSACLELQTRFEENGVHLAAHYIIPQDDSVFPDIVQVAHHEQAVILTNSIGEDVPVTDAVVIMLVGNSGRNISGRRMPANPTWFTYYQLDRLQIAVEAICMELSKSVNGASQVEFEQCRSPEGDKGIRFRNQGASEEYRWGDIADFDKTIFEAYFRNRSGLQASVSFDFQNRSRQFQAGAQFPLVMNVGPAAHTLEVERLTRCHNGKVVWETVRNRPVYNETRVSLNDMIFYDAGPNNNGQQFFRMRVYGGDGLLTGWAVEHVFLTGVKKDLFASEKPCN